MTVLIHCEEDMYVALCPEFDIASQGETVEAARQNLQEAITLFLEEADPSEVSDRFHSEQYISTFELMQKRLSETTVTVPVPDHQELKPGTLSSIIRQSGLPRSEFE